MVNQGMAVDANSEFEGSLRLGCRRRNTRRALPRALGVPGPCQKGPAPIFSRLVRRR